MRPPKLTAIRMFDAAARHLNFRRAADDLNLTQGAVAQAVRGLEGDLGVTLFNRLARGLALTETGKTYHSEISRGLEIIDLATQKLQPRSDTVSISVPPSFASKWLVPRLPGFIEAHPSVEVRIVASEAIADVTGSEVDVAVRQGKRPFASACEVELFAPIVLCAFCSPRTKIPVKRRSSLERLVDLPLMENLFLKVFFHFSSTLMMAPLRE